MLKRILIWGGLLVVIAVVGIVVWVGPRNIIGLIRFGGQAREGDLQVGDPAPMVSLVGLDGTTSRSLGEWVGERPLVLVFGSFT